MISGKGQLAPREMHFKDRKRQVMRFEDDSVKNYTEHCDMVTLCGPMNMFFQSPHHPDNCYFQHFGFYATTFRESYLWQI